MPAQIPGKYVDESGADFAAPMAAILTSVGLLGQEDKNSQQGLSELQAGASRISKVLGGAAGAAGLTGLLTVIGGAFSSAQEPTRVALIAGGSLIAAAAAIALALVVQGDSRARAESTVAQYQARGQISSAFFSLTSSLIHPPSAATKNGLSTSPSLLLAVAATNPNRLFVKARNHDQERRVTDVQLTPAGETEVRLDDGDWVQPSQVERVHVHVS